jgi:ABC-type transporter Mla subunit MlaD
MAGLFALRVGVVVDYAVRTPLVVVMARQHSLFRLSSRATLSPLRLEGEPMRPGMRPALGRLATFAILAIIGLAVGACQSSSTSTAAVTVYVLSPQAGLVMNKDAPVTLLGSEVGKPVEVGKVASTKARPSGQTELDVAIDSSQLHLIPVNVLVKITEPTAVQLIVPAHPAPQRLHAGVAIIAQPSAAYGADPRS